jgi:DNA-binding MarR family transcriptional regulator
MDAASEIARSPVHLLHRASQVVGDVFARSMKTSGLTPRQLAVLVTVEAHEGLSQTGLVERTRIDRSTLADIVKRLTRKRLLQRRRTKEDARAYAVRLTGEGREVLRQVAPLAVRVDQHALGALPGPRRDAFLGALGAIVGALEEAAGAAAAGKRGRKTGEFRQRL